MVNGSLGQIGFPDNILQGGFLIALLDKQALCGVEDFPHSFLRIFVSSHRLSSLQTNRRSVIRVTYWGGTVKGGFFHPHPSGLRPSTFPH